MYGDWKPMIFSTPNFETMFNKKLTEHQPDFHIGRDSALGTWKRMLVWCNTQQTQLTPNWTPWTCISYCDYYKGYLASNYMLSWAEVTWSGHRNQTKSMSYQYQVEYGENRKMWKVIDLAPKKKMIFPWSTEKYQVTIIKFGKMKSPGSTSTQATLRNINFDQLTLKQQHKPRRFSTQVS